MRRPLERRDWGLAAALLLSFVATAWIASPLWVGLALGMVMAFTAQPVHRAIERHLRGRGRLASILATLLAGLAMLAAGVAAAVLVVREGLRLLALAQTKLSGDSIGHLLGERGGRVLAALGVDRVYAAQRIQSELEQLSGYGAQAFGLVLQTTTAVIVTVVIALWTMYYVLLEWPRISSKLEALLPLDPRDTRALMREFRDVGRGAFVATIASAAAQGVLAWIGFAIAGVSQAETWSVLLAILSLVPVIGTAIVWVPVAAYLLSSGHIASGIFVSAWSLLVVMALTDYVIRPRLVGAHGHGHPLLTLVSLLGGITVLGLPGLVVGPVVVSLFVAILSIYERDALR